MSFQTLPARVLLVLSLLPALSLAQEFRATVSGTVTDPQGAVIPGAKIDVMNTQTNSHGIVNSTDRGVFSLPGVEPGKYTVTAEAKGFKKEVRDNVEVTVGERLTLDFKLEVGAVSETVTVSSESVLLETTASTSGTTINTDLVDSLPLLGSNPYSLIALSNGNSHLSAFPDHLSERPFDNGGIDGYAINGGPAGGNNNSYLIDGAPNNTNEGLGFVPPPEAVGEVKVTTNPYDAEFGKTGGGITSVTLKGGANDFHALGNMNIRNEALNANLTQNNAAGIARSASRWLEPTITVSGPVILPKLYNGKNKTFFSYSYEYLYDGFPNTTNRSYPTALERTGDFSQTIGANKAPITLYDPLTTNSAGARTTFTGGVIPGSRIDPVMLKLASVLPLPNVASCTSIRLQGCTNYFSTDLRGDHYHADTAKIDRNINDKEKFFASFELGNRLEFIPNPGDTASKALDLFPISHTWRINHGATFNLSSILSPTTVNTFKVNWLRHNGLGRSVEGGADPTKFGFAPTLETTFGATNFPSVNFGTYSGFAQSGSAATTFNTNWTISDTVNKVVRKHGLKFGILMTETLQNGTSQSLIPGISFSSVFTQQNFNTADNNSGDGLATALLGYPTGASYTTPFAGAYATRYIAPFIQDDWRVTSHLTVSLGLRYDYQSPVTERYDRGNLGFDPNSAYTIGTTQVKGGYTFLSGDHRQGYNRSFLNFQPRLGIAYNISKKLVFRGGWGRSFVQGYVLPGSVGYQASTSIVPSPDGLNKVPTILSGSIGLSANGYAKLFQTGLNQPTGASLGAATNAGGAVTFIDPNYKIPYVNDFNAGLDYELPMRTIFHIEYSGSRSHNLPVSKPIDALTLSQYQTLGASQQNSVTNPFAGSVPGQGLNSATTTAGQLLLPFPQFTGVTESNIPIGKLWYDSLQARVDKRLSNGLTFLVTYTWSKNIGATDYMNSSYDCVDCLRRALVSGDQPQLLNISMAYHVPFFTKSQNRFARTFIGGWTIAGDTQFQTGNLIASPTQNGTNGFVSSTGVDPSKPTSAWPTATYAREFNTCTVTAATGARSNCLSADEPAAWIINPNFGLATLSPRFSGLRNVRAPSASLSLSKVFAITERVKFALRADFLNISNTPFIGYGDNTAGIGTNASQTSFGRATGNPGFNQGNDPRTIQVSGRLSF